MIIVYGYLAYYLFNRYQSNLPTLKTGDQSSRISYNGKRRNTLFSISIAVSYTACSVPAAVGWLMQEYRVLLKASKWVLAMNSAINPILYFWKSYLTKKTTKSDEPKKAIRLFDKGQTASESKTPETSRSRIGNGSNFSEI